MNKIKAGDPITQSEDIGKQNIETLKTLFPTIVKEGKIDIEELKALIGDEAETGDEYYRFTWAGKSMARREANKPTTATLRPNKADSKDWNTTQNIFIEGDNLEVLKLLQKSYADKIKMIYIDPPYNTGKDFVYKDNYADNLGNYLAQTGQTNEEGKKLSTNNESDGRYHSNWLNMMYPRLKLARNLLEDGGVIFISIDDNEIENLRKLCNEIFGEDNFVAQFIWAAGKKNDLKLVSVSHEYVLCYLKNKQYTSEKGILWRQRKKGLDDIYKEYARLKKTHQENYKKIEEELKRWFKELPKDDSAKRQAHYSSVDKRGIFFPDNISWPGGGGPKYEVMHPVTKKPVKIPSRGWIFSLPEKMQEMIDADRVYFGEDENSVPCFKSYLFDRESEVPYSVFYVDGRSSTKRLRELIGGDLFEHPKDELVLKEIIEFSTNKDCIVLDFFAGSGTTAHAVMELNSQDNGNRKFICVQWPEPTDVESLAFKAGYKNIAEITKERIRRAGEKVKSGVKADLFNGSGDRQDIGFKAFKLDSSNIMAWDGNPEKFEANLFNSASNIKESRTEEDILFEILLKNGLDLTLAIEEKTISGKKVFNIGAGALFICLADNITTAVSEGIGKWKENLNPSTCKVIFKDNGFTDVEKTNSIQILKRYGIADVNSI